MTRGVAFKGSGLQGEWPSRFIKATVRFIKATVIRQEETFTR